MICKHCRKDIPDREVRSYVFSSLGKASGPRKARDPGKMSAAAHKRWDKERKRS